MRSSKSPTEPFPLLTHVRALNTLKQLRAAEGGNKRNNADGKKNVLLLSYGWEGRRAFQTVGCLSVCACKCVSGGERVCVR